MFSLSQKKERERERERKEEKEAEGRKEGRNSSREGRGKGDVCSLSVIGPGVGLGGKETSSFSEAGGLALRVGVRRGSGV